MYFHDNTIRYNVKKEILPLCNALPFHTQRNKNYSIKSTAHIKRSVIIWL